MFCGIDIVEIRRIEEMAVRHPASLTRFFTTEELAYCALRPKAKYASMAGIFAAKEAFFKALGTGFRKGKWVDVEILHTELGAPYFHLTGEYAVAAAEWSAVEPALSISHDGAYAIAQVVWPKG